MSAWEGLSPPYSTIVADPPWHYDDVNPPNPESGYGVTRPTEPLPYSTLSLADIKALPVGDLAADGRCFLWVTNRYLFDAPDVLRAWGFQPMGTLNVTTEYVVIGKRGNPPRMPWHGTTWFQWPRKAHSAKPPAFADLVESWCPGPYVELFARAPRLGWDSWGHGYELGEAS